MNIAFIGAGNLAWHLAPELENAGHNVKLLSGRSNKNLEALAERLYDPEIKNNLDFSDDPVQLICITTPDQAISEIVSEIVLPDDCMLIHCAASLGIEILEPAASPDYGVMYPLQTFTKGYKVEFNEIPIFIEGSNKKTEDTLHTIARSVSKNIFVMDSLTRRHIHLAAIFAGNFSNHLLTIADDMLAKHQLDLDVLWPLIKATVQKAMETGPANAQTGPAIRKDFDTMDAHMELLRDNPDLEEMYNVISKHIIKTYDSQA